VDGGKIGSDPIFGHRTDENRVQPYFSPEPNVFIYDSYPGGIGFSAPLYAMHDELLAKTRDLIAGCPCESGCPSCVGPEGNTGPLAKTAALRILEMLNAEV
jgi:DEAD/DEAH box helicase domain-containing protein